MRTRVGQGGTVERRCPLCGGVVFLVFRGTVTAYGEARIVRVDRNGDAHVQCPCGASVVWHRRREPARS